MKTKPLDFKEKPDTGDDEDRGNDVQDLTSHACRTSDAAPLFTCLPGRAKGQTLSTFEAFTLGTNTHQER